MKYTKVAARLRENIMNFSGELSLRLPKVAQRLVAELIYGIQASQSVTLTKIARVLEEKTSIKKTEERLSRQLSRESLGAIVQDNLLACGASHIDQDTLLIFDPSDLQKKYAQKMEYLCTVRDGSEEKLGNGYCLCTVAGAEVDGDVLVPLYGGLYSTISPDFVSENEEWLTVIDTVSAAVSKQGIWVIDRGVERNNIMKPLLDRGLRFIIRLIGNRNLLLGKKTLLAEEIAYCCRCPYTETIVKKEDGQEKVYHLSFGYNRVKLPGRNEVLYLLVVHGFGKEPMLLLTTEALRENRKVLWQVVRSYLRRWAIEETIRFVKQSYELEDVRVLGYDSLRNLLPLVMAAAYFAAVVLDGQAKLRIMAGYVFKAAKRLFGIPDFCYYAIADGLMSIFQRHPGRVYAAKPRLKPSQRQLLLFTGASP